MKSDSSRRFLEQWVQRGGVCLQREQRSVEREQQRGLSLRQRGLKDRFLTFMEVRTEPTLPTAGSLLSFGAAG